MVKVSVIIPIYNTENYLARCLESVCKQTLQDIEIICVNDCSTDNSLEIIKNYMKEDNRIELIDFKENKGVAVARNTAIAHAKGEYIGFVDSDDYVDLDFYGNLYKKAYETKADIIKSSDINVIYPDGTTEIRPQNDLIKQNKINFWVQFYTAIYKKEFLEKNNILFPQNMLVCEDIAFVTKSAILANKIEIEPTSNYYYVRRSNSLDSNQYDSKKVDSVIEYCELITSFIKNYDLVTSDKQILYSRIIAQLDGIRKFKVEINSDDYKKLTKLYLQKVFEKMRLK
jgi:glycosyltransferase involved in cell wall biosynthesis